MPLCAAEKKSLDTANPDSEFALETWRVTHTLRAGVEVYDITWSHDAAHLLAAGIDNCARVFGTGGGGARSVHVLADHTHYVQVLRPRSLSA